MPGSWRTAGLLLTILSGGLALSGYRTPSTRSFVDELRGQVIDDEGPLAGAVVRIKGQSESVLTDAAGVFHLPDAPPNSRIVAAKTGYLIAGANAGGGEITIHLKRYADDDAPDYQWVDPRPDASDPARCANCHPETFAEWSRSAHAASATNRRFLNVYDGTDWHGRANRGWSLLAEAPLGKAVCYSCHVPSPPTTVEAVEDLRAVRGVDALGIHCDFCHKITEVQTAQVGLNHGRFAMRHVRPSRGQVFFGPFADVDRGENAWLPLYRQSAYCASCHEGTMFGIAAYTTYSEWQASDYARRGVQCQGCHMASSGKRTSMAVGAGAISRDPATLSDHEFRGGHPELLRAALSLDLAVEQVAGQWQVTTQVRVRGVGHRIPTGHPSRELILHVDARSLDGQQLAQLAGPVLPGTAGEGDDQHDLAGRPGQRYAKSLESFEGEADVPVWRAGRIASDTRLPPDAEDRKTYLFSGTGPVKIVAELIYRRFSSSLADQKAWPDNQFLIVRREWSSPP
jgi:hypothetical protein